MSSELNNPPVLLKPFANSGDKNTIPELATGTQRASLDEGFPPITSTPLSQGGIPPERADFNGLGNMLSTQYFYLQNGGKFTFNQDVSDAIGGYPQNSILQYLDTNTGEFYQVRSLINNNTYNFNVTPSYIDGLKWEKIKVSPTRNMGEVVLSTIPLVDASLHLLDGALIAADGIYAEFVTYIASLVSSYPSLFVTEQVWQETASSQGTCEKFVYDSVNGTLRLPLYGNKIVTSSINDIPTLGNGDTPTLDQIWGITTGGDTVSFFSNLTPNLNCYYYIVVGNYVKTEITVDIDQIANDLNHKQDILISGTNIKTVNGTSLLGSGNINLANTDLSNITSMAQENLVDLLFPVGSCYMTTANTCPLASIKGTWVEETCRVLVEKKEATDNDQSWYNLYSDGWCEQGGVEASGSSTVVTLSKAFKDTNYTVQSLYVGTTAPGYAMVVENSSTSTFTLKTSGGSASRDKNWQACGYTSTTTGHKRFRRTA